MIKTYQYYLVHEDASATHLRVASGPYHTEPEALRARHGLALSLCVYDSDLNVAVARREIDMEIIG